MVAQDCAKCESLASKDNPLRATTRNAHLRVRSKHCDNCTVDLGFKNIHECKQYISFDFTVERLFYTSKRIICSAVHYHHASTFLYMTNIFLFIFLCCVLCSMLFITCFC